MPSEWAYCVAREQRRDIDSMANNLDMAYNKGRLEWLEKAAKLVADGRWLAITDIAAAIRALKEAKE